MLYRRYLIDALCAGSARMNQPHGGFAGLAGTSTWRSSYCKTTLGQDTSKASTQQDCCASLLDIEIALESPDAVCKRHSVAVAVSEAKITDLEPCLTLVVPKVKDDDNS
jgi:hypothetical protein